MPLDVDILCKYRLDRAKEDLEAAKCDHEAGLYKAAITGIFITVESYLEKKLKEKTD